MAASVHSDDEEQADLSEPGEDGYWPAIEILKERKHDYLVNWDGINPETGRAWTPSWTGKSEVTEDLIEAWEAIKYATRKNTRRTPKKSKRSRITAATVTDRPATRSSRSSRTSRMTSSRASDSPVISLTSDNSPRTTGEPSLGKRKRRGTKASPADEDPKPVPKKQRIDDASSSASHRSRTKSTRSSKHISKEMMNEEEEVQDFSDVQNSDKMPRSPSPSEVGVGTSIVRIGPPRGRKKIPPLSLATPASSRTPNPAFRDSREEEEENTQEAAGTVSHFETNPPTVKKKKRRLKPPSDVHPARPVLAENKPLPPPSRDTSQEPEEPSDQEEPLRVDQPPLDQDNGPTEPEPTPPRSSRQRSLPDPQIDDESPTPTPRANRSAEKLAPVPRLEPSHFKPYLQTADTTSVIDEFSPKKAPPTQDAIESPDQGSQVPRSDGSPDPEPVDDHLDPDITQEMQDMEDAYIDLNGQANGIELVDQEQVTTDPDSTEYDLPRSPSPAESMDIQIPVRSSEDQELEDALVLLNQKSEEIEVLESRLAAQEAQMEHTLAENHRIQVEYEKLSVAQEVQREALDDAKGTVSEMDVHIEWQSGLLEQHKVKLKQLREEVDEIRATLNSQVKEHELARTGWEEEKAALEAQLASLGDRLLLQSTAGWELGKKELEDKLAESTKERDQLDKDKRYAENEVESWKDQYRQEFMHSQELRLEAKNAKAETSRVQGENAILASQNKEAVRLVTAKYEAVVDKLKMDLAKAESLYKVLQRKDEQTGDELRKRAMSSTRLQEEVRRLQEDIDSILADQAARTAELEREERYACRWGPDNGALCDKGFDSPQELWTHIISSHSNRSGTSK